MDNSKIHILIVDDDDKIRDLLKQYLKNNNFFVSTAINASDAEEKLKIVKFDLAIIDIMMPGKDGLQLTKEIREKIDLPIILLTAKGEAEDRVRGLELGAEDYLPKPFEPKELLLRIKNVIKRIKKNKHIITAIKIGKANINIKKMEIQKDKKIIKINASEKILLENMISSAGKIFSREDISKITNLTPETVAYETGWKDGYEEGMYDGMYK